MLPEADIYQTEVFLNNNQKYKFRLSQEHPVMPGQFAGLVGHVSLRTIQLYVGLIHTAVARGLRILMHHSHSPSGQSFGAVPAGDHADLRVVESVIHSGLMQHLLSLIEIESQILHTVPQHAGHGEIFLTQRPDLGHVLVERALCLPHSLHPVGGTVV